MHWPQRGPVPNGSPETRTGTVPDCFTINIAETQVIVTMTTPEGVSVETGAAEGYNHRQALEEN